MKWIIMLNYNFPGTGSNLTDEQNQKSASLLTFYAITK